MAKTYTPELDPEALSRLDAYAARSRDAFAADRPARWCPAHLRGPITDGERMSIEPLPRRVPLPRLAGDAGLRLPGPGAVPSPSGPPSAGQKDGMKAGAVREADLSN